MELALSENIRNYRRARALTQEQLAEVLGVTTGAVYKWESGLSTPELGMILEMADFFDVSVDTLLGYRMKDNRIESTLRRLNEYSRTRDPEALAEAEKALKKYPNSFKIVHACAGIYTVFGVGERNRDKQRRALELFEQARLLIDQNDDPKIGELTILSEMSAVYYLMGETDKSVELLKKHNTSGIFSDSIGLMLACELRRFEEAEPYLAMALLGGVSQLVNTVTGYVFLFCARGDHASALEILNWGMGMLNGLKKSGDNDFTEKIIAVLHILLAYVQLKTGGAQEAEISVQKAAEGARRFDAKPDYGLTTLRFAAVPDSVSAFDGLGETAKESVEGILGRLEDPALSAMWEEAAIDG